MTGKTHTYSASVTWTGNTGTGTSGYRAYDREHVIHIDRKPDITGSADPAFRGDATRHNPEDLLIASLSTCHMLWYLHLATDAGVIVVAYTDTATATMVEHAARGGYFIEAVLHPQVTIAAGSDAALAAHLHQDAHKFCYVANSLNFPVRCEPVVRTA